MATSVPSDWPNAGLSRFVACPPHNWHVQMTGTGPDLLLIHGAGGAVHSWRDLVVPLSARYRVLAIDLPGHGFTRLGTRRRSGLEPMSADIAALLRHLEVRPSAIVGHSAGAAIALQLAQILGPAPERIVSINGALENFPGLAGVLFPLIAKALALNPLTGAVVATTMSRKATQRLIEGTGSHIDARGIDLYTRLFRDRLHVSGTLGMMEQWSLNRLLPTLCDIPQPTLLLAGSRDVAVAPKASRTAAEHLPQGVFRSFADAGHLLHEEQPLRATEEILGFLDRPAAR
jgi:magnesium chelatase accessory protein